LSAFCLDCEASVNALKAGTTVEVLLNVGTDVAVSFGIGFRSLGRPPMKAFPSNTVVMISDRFDNKDIIPFVRIDG